MTILYLTSTGNCLSVARRIGGDLRSIPQELKNGDLHYTDDKIGIIFPVYGLCTPPLVVQFLKRAEFKCDYLFAVITYGFYAGAAADNMIRNSDNKKFDYVNILNMTENYIPAYEMEKEINKNKPDETKLNEILTDINNNRKFIRHDSALDKFLTWTHVKNFAYSIGTGYSKDYSVNNNCSGCGICAKVCPMGNISISSGKPDFGMNCSSCLACIQNCPTNALHMKQEKSSKRFRNPEISLQQIIEANDQTI